MLNLKSSVRWIDVLDVSIVAWIVYRILILIKGTRAMQMLIGMGIVGSGYYLSSILELFTIHWIFAYFFDSLILLIIVLFQDDLRRAFAHIGKNPFFNSIEDEVEKEMIDEIARTASKMAKEKMGALIVIERETGLKNFIDTGSYLDSKVKAELLHSIFIPLSPIHDGAVIVKRGRIAAAGCFLPLSKNPNIDKHYGTRHRAAIGLTEDTDAIVVLVSEEAGEAYLVKGGKMTTHLDEQSLRTGLSMLLRLSQENIQTFNKKNRKKLG